jgi:pimeloyl-ACP methyl ester carboxylesterase
MPSLRQDWVDLSKPIVKGRTVPSETMTSAVETATSTPTRFIDADGIRFAYRRLGNPNTDAPALVMFQHFMGNLDNYDPLIVDGLAAGREVILTDNAGVGSSGGRAADTVPGMAGDVTKVIDALGLSQVDLFGFSMGGHVAQMVTAQRPEIVRRLMLVGTGPRGGVQRDPVTNALFAVTLDPYELMWLPVMFSPSARSQAAGQRYVDRLLSRTEDRDVSPVSAETVAAHSAAAADWAVGSADYLGDMHQPTLVVNGNNDIIVPTINSYALYEGIANASLLLYPDANHGSHFQYPDHFIGEAVRFLDATVTPPWSQEPTS